MEGRVTLQDSKEIRVVDNNHQRAARQEDDLRSAGRQDYKFLARATISAGHDGRIGHGGRAETFPAANISRTEEVALLTFTSSWAVKSVSLNSTGSWVIKFISLTSTGS